MKYRPNWCEDDTRTWEAPYQFLQPCSVKIRDFLGKIYNINYGIGDIIHVIEPRIQTLQVQHEVMKEIPLPGDCYMIEFPDNIDRITKRVEYGR